MPSDEDVEPAIGFGSLRDWRKQWGLGTALMEMAMELEGNRVLVVEDDGLVAMTVEDMLGELGCVVAATASTLPDALQKVGAGGFDFALLDVNLRGEAVFPVAQVLTEQGIPFAFASGYGAAGLPNAYRANPLVSKPFNIEELRTVLSAALNKSSEPVS
jgi:CheY-like chemotaxis protein